LVAAVVVCGLACDSEEPVVRDAGLDVIVTFDQRADTLGVESVPAPIDASLESAEGADAGADTANVSDRPADFAGDPGDVGDAQGFADAGDAHDTANDSDTSDSAAARIVSLAISPQDAQLVGGTTRTYAAIATFSDGSSGDVTAQATWTSTNPVAAAIAYDPRTPSVTMGVTPGSTTIVAQLDGRKAMHPLQVTGMTLQHLTIRKIGFGNPRQTTRAEAIGIFTSNVAVEERVLTPFVRWEMSQTLGVEVSNTPGLAGMVTFGGHPESTTIRAVLGEVTAEAPIMVGNPHGYNVVASPAFATVAVGTRLRLLGLWVFPTGPSQYPAVWKSSDPTIADFVETSPPFDNGILIAKRPGEVTVTGAVGSLPATARIKVTDATLIRLEIAPTSSAVPQSVALRMKATGVFSDGTHQDLTAFVTWSSSNPNVLSIAKREMRVIGQTDAVGNATVTASYGGQSVSADYTVTAATLVDLTITPAIAAIPLWASQSFAAIGTFSDGSVEDVTDVASWCGPDHCGGNGTVNPMKYGKLVIEAKLGATVARANLEVLELEFESLKISPASSAIARGDTLGLKAEATFLDALRRRLTFDVTNDGAWWASPLDGIVEVENLPMGRPGLVRGLTPGAARVHVSFVDFATAEVTVISPPPP
jgi:hypothetical protein